MPSKEIVLGDDIVVIITKRKQNRSLRMSIAPNGTVKVSIPLWAPYSAGIQFAKSRHAWILEQRQPVQVLRDGQPIGKAHHLRFMPSPLALKPTSRLKNGEVLVTYPEDSFPQSPNVQKAAEQGSLRALRSQAEALLPKRIAQLAAEYGFGYRSVSVKRLKSRWGSCDSDKRIVFNLFLMQLPWECIDYVILHELTHTRIMQHGAPFWKAMEELRPNLKSIRAQMRTFQPVLMAL